MGESCPPCTHIGGYAKLPKDFKKKSPVPHPCTETHAHFPENPVIKKPPGRNCVIVEQLTPKTIPSCLKKEKDLTKCSEDQNLMYLPTESHLLTDTLDSADFLARDIDRTENSQSIPPCYMPQPDDHSKSQHMPEQMGPIGPWATGRVDWSPLAGLTGTRPVVDHYSITRFSTNEWRQRNKDVLTNAANSIQRSLKSENDSKNTMVRTFAMTDQTQMDSTKRLMSRSREIDKWKLTIERAIKAQAEEISTLEEQRQRLKQSLATLRMPEAIATECLDRRCGRPDTELVRDNPEEELVKEVALISEIRDVLNRTLVDVESQQVENRAARERLEYDWSDKKATYENESINCGLNNKSTTILFKAGATRFPNAQSTMEYWEHFSKETLEFCESCRQKSITVRGTLDAILTNAARDLRSQADNVERSLAARISCMEEMRVRLEYELRTCLRCLADTEISIDKLTQAARNMDYAMKVAQTRSDNRNQRPHVENCRDLVQMGLVDEVKSVQDGVSALLASLREAEDTKNELMATRGKLEQEIALKRKAIMLDRDRCNLLRSHFPSAAALSGHA